MTSPGIRPGWARRVRGAWQALGPRGRTIVWCAVVELVVVGLLGSLLHSLALGLAVSVGVIGPVSLWLAPALLAHYRHAERLKASRR